MPFVVQTGCRVSCRSCPDKDKDLGGCRCQAYMLTKNMYATDPVCSKSPVHHQIVEARLQTQCSKPDISDLKLRNPQNSKLFFKRASDADSLL